MSASDERKSVVGVDSLYIAKVTQDDAAAYTTGTPEYLAPVAEISAEPSSNSEDQYADNQVIDTMSSVGSTAVNITVPDLTPEMYAKLTGSKFDSTTGRVYENEGVADYYALGYRSLKSNGKFRYFWFAKVQFGVPKEEAATKKDKPEFKSKVLVAKALKTIHKFTVESGVTDSVKRVWGDEDTLNFSATNWFDAVQTPGIASISALALSSSVPVDDATGVSKSANVTLTFNNALQDGAVDSITLLDAANAVVASAVTLDATKKIITINPTADLAGTEEHKAVYAVTDIYGQHLTGVLTFTTGA